MTPWALFAVAHLVLAGAWFGSMTYSLGVVQPKVDRFFAEPGSREDFLRTLAHGNRWPVVTVIAALVLTAAGVAATGPPPVALGYAVTLLIDLVAAVIFWYVSWRHWPVRVFALPAELPALQHRLRVLAVAMLVLAGTGFVVALTVSVAGAGA